MQKTDHTVQKPVFAAVPAFMGVKIQAVVMVYAIQRDFTTQGGYLTGCAGANAGKPAFKDRY